jgi:hypothetical protein
MVEFFDLVLEQCEFPRYVSVTAPSLNWNQIYVR